VVLYLNGNTIETLLEPELFSKPRMVGGSTSDFGNQTTRFTSEISLVSPLRICFDNRKITLKGHEGHEEFGPLSDRNRMQIHGEKIIAYNTGKPCLHHYMNRKQHHSSLHGQRGDYDFSSLPGSS
jgi:hypothetical protein